MSHFTVLVIGENPEEQLAPFHEFECTGENDQYVQDIDQTEEHLKEWEENTYEDYKTIRDLLTDYHGIKCVDSVDDLDLEEEHKYGYAIFEGDKLVKSVRRTNPNKKWDWYSLGGRWAGFFTVKPNANGIQGHHRAKDFARISGEVVEDLPLTKVDQALKKDIDFELMRNEAGKEAQDNYELAMRYIAHLPVNRTWKEVLESIKNIEEARDFYWTQPRCIAFKNKEIQDTLGFRASCDDFLISKEDYIENARNGAIGTHAVIKDSKWYERGEMGWWGVVSNEKDEEEWGSKVKELLQGIPDDTLLSVYDCHI